MKSSKPLWCISITTAPEAEDAAAELLATICRTATATYFNLETGLSTVSAFCDWKPDAKVIGAEIKAGLKRIAECGLKISPGKLEIAKVKREDWAESWKRHFHPMAIGSRLLVKPSWSKQRPKKGQVVVVLDPGLSFGTGQHPTTSFCLHEICRVGAVRQKSHPQFDAAKSFLDIGTGSGILAIAAGKLGFAPVHAFDFDPESVRVAKENARKNRVADRIKLTRGDITKMSLKPARQYDLVCANLISNLLIAERRRIVSRLKPGGTLVLAGILAAEFAEVQRAFEKSGLKLISSRAENEWRSGSFSFA
jgi:ribosomal protein L11 methyltransferase